MEPASIKIETEPNAENFQSPSQDTSYEFVIFPSLELNLFDITLAYFALSIYILSILNK